MIASVDKPTAPSSDKRWKIVDATMRRHGHSPNSLIETLHTVQEAFGFLDDTALAYVAHSLNVPLSKAFGVATFYHFFTMKPPGEHTCVVCTGTACYIKGAAGLLKSIEAEYKVKPGHSTADNKLSVLTARCLGSCGLAPAIVLDGDVMGNLEPASLIDKIGKRVSK